MFQYSGPVDEADRTYLDIYSVWLPQSGLEPDDFIPLDHYIGDGPQDGHIDIEIWIKLAVASGA